MMRATSAAQCVAPILIVDDDADVRHVLALVLQDEGYRVRCAEHGVAALTQIDSERPALVLLDLMMPVMSGWALWDALQSSRALSMIPVVILTACGLSQGSFGATTVLPKPVSHDRLINAVHLQAQARECCWRRLPAAGE